MSEYLAGWADAMTVIAVLHIALIAALAHINKHHPDVITYRIGWRDWRRAQAAPDTESQSCRGCIGYSDPSSDWAECTLLGGKVQGCKTCNIWTERQAVRSIYEGPHAA